MDSHTKNTHTVLNIFHRVITIGLFSTAVLVSTIIITSKISTPQTLNKKAAQNCPYSATVKVLRADGLPLDGSEKVGNIELGIINNKSASLRKADQILSNQGTFTFSTNNFTFTPYKNGDDAYIYLTNLNTDNWQVTSAFCNQLNNSQFGCDRKPVLIPPRPLVPRYSKVDRHSWSDPQIGPLHVTCDVDIEYGWIISPISGELPKAPRRPSTSKIPHAEILNDLAGYASLDGSTTGGFTHNTKVFTVTNTTDKGSGTLREYAQGNNPKIIIFEKDADISLRSQLFVGSNTSILGLGKKITIKNRGLLLKKANNVIISGLEFSDGKGDAIEIRDSHHVWIDHVSAQKFSDGLIDIVSSSHHVTVSRSKLSEHNKVMLIGNNISDTKVNSVTLWGNYFTNFVQRSPRVRYGTVDMYNNVIENWSNSAIRSTLGATVNAQNNIFIIGEPKKLLPRFAENFNNEPGDEPGNVILKGNFSPIPALQSLVNTSRLTNQTANYVRPYPAYPRSMKKSSNLPFPANTRLLKQIKSSAGSNICQENCE